MHPRAKWDNPYSSVSMHPLPNKIIHTVQCRCTPRTEQIYWRGTFSWGFVLMLFHGIFFYRNVTIRSYICFILYFILFCGFILIFLIALRCTIESCIMVRMGSWYTFLTIKILSRSSYDWQYHKCEHKKLLPEVLRTYRLINLIQSHLICWSAFFIFETIKLLLSHLLTLRIYQWMSQASLHSQHTCRGCKHPVPNDAFCDQIDFPIKQ